MKLGVRLESLGSSIRAALAAAAKLQVAGVQLSATGNLAPDRLGDTGRKDLRHLLRSYGLELTALDCTLRHGLDMALDLQPRLERVMNVMNLSFGLGARKTIVPAPKITAEGDPRSGTLHESLLALASYGDRVGATLALEVGFDSGEALAAVLARIDSGGLGVNYDPANMLAHGFDPVANLAPLKDRIVHTHARDVQVASSSRGPVDVAVGRGDIEWMSYLGTLSALEYSGWVVVETEDVNPVQIEEGVRFLRRIM
jgi:sugar phosphate isomerase/epimerase